MKPSLLVLAAGLGSRFGGLKQLAPVGPAGETLLDYSLYDALQGGFHRIVFLIRRDLEKDFHSTLGKRFNGLLEITYAYQESEDLPQPTPRIPQRAKPWGTGHALWCARRELEEPFAVINADDFYGRDGFAKLSHFLLSPQNNAYALVGYLLAETLSAHGSVSRGIVSQDAAGMLTGVEEWTKLEKHGSGAQAPQPAGGTRFFSGSELVSLNFWGFTTAIFPQIENQFRDFLSSPLNHADAEFYLPAAVDHLVRERQATVQVLRSADNWFGLTYREDLPLVKEKISSLLKQGRYPQQLWGNH